MGVGVYFSNEYLFGILLKFLADKVCLMEEKEMLISISYFFVNINVFKYYICIDERNCHKVNR